MKAKIYQVNGKEVEFYPIGALVYELGRQRQTIRKWEKEGVIPPAHFRSPSGRRLYTRGQIKAIVKAVEKYNIRQGSPIPKEFIEEVHKAFKKATLELLGQLE